MKSAEYKKLLKDIQTVSGLLCDNGWAEKNAGNLSVDVTGKADVPGRSFSSVQEFDTGFENLKNRLFLITYSGSKFRDIAEDAESNLLLIRISAEGNGYRILNSESQRRPTSELRTHLKIHNFLRGIDSEERVVLHTHPTELIALSHIKKYQSSAGLSRLLISAHPEVYINLRDSIGFVKYILTGSERLAQATLKSLKNGKRLIIWERHGALAVEKDVITAFDHLFIANKAADIALRLFASGRCPMRFTDREFSELKGLL
ncbi:MAG: rhamnulose-1-phosphate aldolase [Deltaproteobacteria bacterium]|nr:rhamnulose-1-phosphate aldolase [Deltaproteobacteria bacterium]